VGRYIADAKSKQNAALLTPGDDAVLDATLAIRNVLAHRSPRAQARLRAKLGSQQLPAALRSQTVTAGRVGRYLQAEQLGHPRFRHYFERLAEMAAKLAPYPAVSVITLFLPALARARRGSGKVNDPKIRQPDITPSAPQVQTGT
jgi:hypothetical protein